MEELRVFGTLAFFTTFVYTVFTVTALILVAGIALLMDPMKKSGSPGRSELYNPDV